MYLITLIIHSVRLFWSAGKVSSSWLPEGLAPIVIVVLSVPTTVQMAFWKTGIWNLCHRFSICEIPTSFSFIFHVTRSLLTFHNHFFSVPPVYHRITIFRIVINWSLVQRCIFPALQSSSLSFFVTRIPLRQNFLPQTHKSSVYSISSFQLNNALESDSSSSVFHKIVSAADGYRDILIKDESTVSLPKQQSQISRDFIFIFVILHAITGNRIHCNIAIKLVHSDCPSCISNRESSCKRIVRVPARSNPSFCLT